MNELRPHIVYPGEFTMAGHLPLEDRSVDVVVRFKLPPRITLEPRIEEGRIWRGPGTATVTDPDRVHWTARWYDAVLPVETWEIHLP